MTWVSWSLDLMPPGFVSVPMVVPKTTSETLKHKINPSAGETAPRAVDVLLYTPGTGFSSLPAGLGTVRQLRPGCAVSREVEGTGAGAG